MDLITRKINLIHSETKDSYKIFYIEYHNNEWADDWNLNEHENLIRLITDVDRKILDLAIDGYSDKLIRLLRYTPKECLERLDWNPSTNPDDPDFILSKSSKLENIDHEINFVVNLPE